jgi:hypothetical protein
MTFQDFDSRSGSLIERALFNHRWIVVVLCALVTAVLGWQATKLKLNASFEKTIPAHHAYIANFLTYQNELAGLGNAVRISVEAQPQSFSPPLQGEGKGVGMGLPGAAPGSPRWMNSLGIEFVPGTPPRRLVLRFNKRLTVHVIWKSKFFH